MFEVKIYGEIVSTYSKQNGAKGVSLADVQAQLEKAEGQPVKVRINSVGGDVNEGFAIYDELRRYAKKNEVKVHTFGEGTLASIATVIFLAGDTRELTRAIEPFIHNAWVDASGDHRVLSDTAETLERYSNLIARHYSEHTDLSFDEARQLMNQDVSLTPEEAKKIKFATTIEAVQRPVVLARFTNTNKPNMNQKKKGLLAKLTDFFDGINNKIVLDAEQREVDFYELGEDDPIEVGDKATIDGKDAEGEVVMSDSEIFVFEAGTLVKKIKETETSEDTAEDDEVAALKARIAELESANETISAKYEKASAKAKDLSATVAKFKTFESQLAETDPDPAPSAQASRKPEAKKGQVASAAIQNMLKNQSIKK